MSLAADATFGPYEIVGPLVAGGMGEMYRAKIGQCPIGRIIGNLPYRDSRWTV
jgi:hypothetical protein